MCFSRDNRLMPLGRVTRCRVGASTWHLEGIGVHYVKFEVSGNSILQFFILGNGIKMKCVLFAGPVRPWLHTGGAISTLTPGGAIQFGITRTTFPVYMHRGVRYPFCSDLAGGSSAKDFQTLWSMFCTQSFKVLAHTS